MAAEPVTASPARVGVLHVHSDYSHDGRDSVERLRELALERGIGFVGLTDHAEDFEPDKFTTLADHCRAVSDERVRILPGLEFRFAGHSGLHLLALGLRRWMVPRTPAEFIAGARDNAGFTIVAHPLLADYAVPEEVQAGIDAIEVWNASYNTRYLPDPRAMRLLHRIRARRPGVVGIAGLDQHDGRNDRGTRVVLERESEDPLAELRAGRFRNLGVTMRFDPGAGFGAPALLGLTALRDGLDLVNAVHERVMRALR